MSKAEFYSRKGATPYDTNILMGINEELLDHEQEALDGGWKTPQLTDYIQDDGVASPKGDYFAFINETNIDKLVAGAEGRMHFFPPENKFLRLSIAIQHESLHPKMDFLRYFDYKDSRRTPGGHTAADIMRPLPYRSPIYAPELIFRLQWLHNYKP